MTGWLSLRLLNAVIQSPSSAHRKTPLILGDQGRAGDRSRGGAWSLRVPSLVTSAGQIPGNLAGNVSPHVVIPWDHLKGPTASEAPDVAEITASVEGRCCRAVSQAMGANVPGQAGGLAQTANDAADRFPGKSNVRGRLGTVEPMEERAGFVAASLDPSDQGGRGLIG
jgi:hypothetical protein